MSNVIMGIPFTDAATLTPGAEDADMPASNLQSRHLSKRWRSVDLDAMDSRFSFDPSLLDPQTRGLFAQDAVTAKWDSMWAAFLPGDISINAEIGRRSHSSVATVYARVVPNAVALTNATGAVGDIDEDPYALDANDINGTTAGVTTTVAVDFATPASTPAVGARNQLFRVAINSNDTGAGSTISVTISVREGGGALASESFVIPTDGTTEILQFAWDADLLGTASGAAAQCHITATNARFDLEAVDWVAASVNLAWAPIFQTGAFESGVSGNTAFPYAGPMPVMGPVVVRVAHVVTSAAIGQVYLRDCYRGLTQHAHAHDYGTWLQMRRLFLARDFSADFINQAGDLLPIDPSVEVAGTSGARFFDPRPSYRQGSVQLQPQTAAAAFQDLVTRDRRDGGTKEVGIALVNTLTTHAHHLALLATVRPTTTGFGAMMATDRYARTIEFRETPR
jgi:hypothetical protein